MVVKSRKLFERPATGGAGVWFIILMVQPVLVIRLLESEGLFANVAFVRHFSRVQALVLLQKILGREHFTANIALPLLAFVGFQMLHYVLFLNQKVSRFINAFVKNCESSK